MIRIISVIGLLVSLFAQNMSFAAETPFADPYAKVRSFRLANGLKVIVAPNEDSKTFQIKVRVDAGTFNEEPNKAGTAHLLEHYLFTDAKSEKDMTYLEVIKEKGGSGNAYEEAKPQRYTA
jgi:predicted Zn-dependent peptidase